MSLTTGAFVERLSSDHTDIGESIKSGGASGLSSFLVPWRRGGSEEPAGRLVPTLFLASVALVALSVSACSHAADQDRVAGTVCDVGLFSPGLNTPDNVHILVPNSRMLGETIKNFSMNDTRRNDLVMRISYDDEIGKALEVIRRVLAEEPRLLREPAPTVAVAELADSSVNIVVRPWCQRTDYWSVRCDLTRTLKAGGCSIPYPQTDVHVRRADAA